MGALGGMGVALALFLIVVAVLWICMPFAIFGTKPILQALVVEMKENNKLMREMKERLASPGDSVRKT